MLHTCIAVIADVHGNTWALDAVLADIARQGITHIVDLGDSVYGPLDPAGTAARLMAAGIPSVQGNEDRILVSPPEGAASPTLRYTLDSLPAAARAWLGGLPRTRVAWGDLLAFHGTPGCDQTYLLEAVTPRGVDLRTEEAIRGLVAPATQPVILCGHSHTARTVLLPSGQLVVNPGSVGLQAYDDDAPFPHAMQSGSPHARYAVLRRDAGAWHVAQHAVPYAWDAAAACALEHGRPDWARWLATGRA